VIAVALTVCPDHTSVDGTKFVVLTLPRLVDTLSGERAAVVDRARLVIVARRRSERTNPGLWIA